MGSKIYLFSPELVKKHYNVLQYSPLKWNLSLTDTLGPDIFDQFCCNIEVSSFKQKRLKIY